MYPTVQDQVDAYIAGQSQAKRDDLIKLHGMIMRLSPSTRLWFLDGRNSEGKVVSNPNIGYGETVISYANGNVRSFYKVGLSANSSGLSIYLMNIKDRKHLSETYAASLGKAKISGYCIKIRSLSDVDVAVLEEIIANHLDGSTCAS
jgi:hypothetical protein